MNKISTGHPAFDIFLCMLVPLIIRHFLPRLQEYVQALFKERPTSEKVFNRAIEYTQRNSYCW